MKLHLWALALVAMFGFGQLVEAQCATIPSESPVLAPDPSDIPRVSSALLLDYQANWFEGKPNHNVAYVQTDVNEQKVWFYINSVPHYPNMYYNRRYRADSTSPWYWAYNRSVRVMSVAPAGTASFSVNTVLYSPTPKYGIAANGILYKYMMFGVYQPRTCDGLGASAGYAMMAFSTNGTCWTQQMMLRKIGGPSSECAPDLGSELVSVEAMDAIDVGNKIYAIGIEGNVPQLTDPANMHRTLASWGYITPGNAEYVTVPGSPELSAAGVVSPEGIADSLHRYKTYSYFINLAIAWDAVHNDLYLTRGYPYPFDRQWAASPVVPAVSDVVPAYYYNSYLNDNQYVSGCPGSPATYPNRVQYYKMHLSSLSQSDFSQITTGTWTLVADVGNNVGYSYNVSGNNIPIASPQTSVGRDYGAASFLRTGAGTIQPIAGAGYSFPATQHLSPLSVAPCRQTGLERSYLMAVPALTFP